MNIVLKGAFLLFILYLAATKGICRLRFQVFASKCSKPHIKNRNSVQEILGNGLNLFFLDTKIQGKQVM